MLHHQPIGHLSCDLGILPIWTNQANQIYTVLLFLINLIPRKCLKLKTGYAGRLDSLVTGIFVLSVGEMTKKLGKMMETNKRYTIVIDLSATTAGHDGELSREEVQVD